MGPPKCFDVSLPACHSLRTPADLHILAINGCFVLASGALKPWPSTTSAISKLFQLSGHAVAPTAYRILCVRFTCLVRLISYCLRHRRNTRYGWVASPCPAGTRTQQDTPSLAWRDNARVQGATTAATPLLRLPWNAMLACILRGLPLELSLQFLQELPVGALRDQLLWGGLDHPDLVQT